jgi:hypothetical protein
MVEAGQTCQADCSLVAGIGIPRLVVTRRPAISVGVAKAERSAKEQTAVTTEPAVKTVMEVAATVTTEVTIAAETAGSKWSDAAKSTKMAAITEPAAAKMAAATTEPAAAKMAAATTEPAATATTAGERIGGRQASAGKRQRSQQECNLRHHLLFHREALLFNALAVS